MSMRPVDGNTRYGVSFPVQCRPSLHIHTGATSFFLGPSIRREARLLACHRLLPSPIVTPEFPCIAAVNLPLDNMKDFLLGIPTW